MKLHLEGKTEQARADLARLAIIKKQREDAAKKRDELKKGEGGCFTYDHLLLLWDTGHRVGGVILYP